MSNLHYFKGSIAFSILAILLGYWYGGIAGAYAVAILGILETSLSVDNAVVNAKKLEEMDPYWRKMFITVGMIIAVFGMRILFPIIIVAFSTGMDSFPSVTTWI